MTQPRAADDFEVIRERLDQLRREREENAPKTGDGTASAEGDDAADEAERRRRDRVDGAPPPWVPTIFLPQPTD